MNPQKDLNSKLERPHFLKVQSGKIAVWLASSMMHQHQNKCIKCLTDQVNSVKIKIKISLKRQMRK